MKCRIQSESYQEESRLKASCIKLEKTNWLQEGKTLINEIRTMR